MHNIRTGESISFTQASPPPATAQWHNTIGKLNPGGHRAGHCHRPTGHTIVTRQFAPYGGRIPTATGVRFHINRKATYRHPRSSTTRSVLPSQRGMPAGTSITQHPACDANRVAPQHDQQGVPATKPMAWWRPWPALASTCATKPKSKPPHIRNRGVTDLDRGAGVDGLLNAGCTLQQTRELLTREIDWRLRCGAKCW